MDKNAPSVVCVLSKEQQSDYQPDFDRIAGVEFEFTDSPDDALDAIAGRLPSILIVGMEVDGTEGLELVAMLMQRYPDSGGKVVVLPDKGDPFLPVVHEKDHASGRSVTEHMSFDEVAKLIAQCRQQPEAIADDELASSAEPLEAPAKTAPATPPTTARPSSALDSTPSAQPPPRTVNAPSRNRILAISVAILSLILLVAFVATRGAGEPARPPDKAAAPITKSAAPSETSVPPTTSDARSTPDASAPVRATASATDAAPATAPFAELREHRTVPISFARGQTAFRVDDAESLDKTLEAFVAALKADKLTTLEIGGHASVEGSEEGNDEVALGRARAVRKLLISKGAPAKRLTLRSYGSSMPGATRDESRRVTLRLVR